MMHSLIKVMLSDGGFLLFLVEVWSLCVEGRPVGVVWEKELLIVLHLFKIFDFEFKILYVLLNALLSASFSARDIFRAEFEAIKIWFSRFRLHGISAK